MRRGRAGAQVQDTIPIHAAHMSQQVALRALRAGPEWLRGRTSELEQNRRGAFAASFLAAEPHPLSILSVIHFLSVKLRT